MTRVDDARIAASYAARRMLFVARVSTTPALFFVFVDEERCMTTSRVVQRLVAKTPSSASCVLNPAFSNRLATSRGTSRSLVSLFGLPV
jgi:hypothetical protein